MCFFHWGGAGLNIPPHDRFTPHIAKLNAPEGESKQTVVWVLDVAILQ
jgi:hypothetical protein